MVNSPLFIEKIVNMTAIHDLELIEYSLLKTLSESIAPQELFILKFNRKGDPCYRLSLKQENLEIIWKNIFIPEEILAGIKVVSKTLKPYTFKVDSTTIMTVWQVMQSKEQEVFLVTTTPKILNELNTHMIKGLLGVYRNFCKVIIESQLDQLTGLANRKTFDDTISKIHLQRERRREDNSSERRDQINPENTGFWIGMCDLDNFKRVNDNWGHLYGDEVLLLSSQLMQSHFRENDYLFRFGGEEFVIVVYASDQEKALLSFDRFRIAMEEHYFPQVGQVTISIGVTKLDPNIFTAIIMDKADKALYYAKSNGRNQVRFYEELVEKGLLQQNEIIAGNINIF